MVSVLRLLDPAAAAAAAAQVAVPVSLVLIRLGQLPHAAEEVAAREILLCVTKIFARHAEVLSCFTEVIVVVVVMMVAMAAVAALAALIEDIAQDIAQHISEERCRK